MQKKKILFAIFLSLLIHLYFSFSYPLIRDELNVWNMFYNGQNFHEFWQTFIKYDTQQPLFYLIWYPIFDEKLTELFLRLPSILMFLIGSTYIWQKLFPYDVEENKVPWVLFLFSPFLVMYSSFFLPYSLLILTSLFNFYRFNKLSKKFNLKNLSLFFLSCILITFTHYYGALQAILLSIFFIYEQKSVRLKIFFAAVTLAILMLLLTASDFLNDLSSNFNSQKIPHVSDILGDINLLIGGRYIVAILLLLLIFKKKISILKTKEFVFIITVILISYAKSILISPSFEARYFLILIYPLYKLTTGLQVKHITSILIAVSIYSLYVLQQSFSPSFVIDYRKIERATPQMGFLTGPCPRFYFRENNYKCKGHHQNKYELSYEIKEMVVDQINLQYFQSTIPKAICKPIAQGLKICTIPLDNQL